MNAQTKLKIKSALELILTENMVNFSRGLKELEKNADVSVIEILVSIVASSTNREIKKGLQRKHDGTGIEEQAGELECGSSSETQSVMKD